MHFCFKYLPISVLLNAIISRLSLHSVLLVMTVTFDSGVVCLYLQARNTEQKRLWCQQLKKSIIDNYEAVIPDKAKQLVMSLGADSVVEGALEPA